MATFLRIVAIGSHALGCPIMVSLSWVKETIILSFVVNRLVREVVWQEHQRWPVFIDHELKQLIKVIAAVRGVRQQDIEFGDAAVSYNFVEVLAFVLHTAEPKSIQVADDRSSTKVGIVYHQVFFFLAQASCDQL